MTADERIAQIHLKIKRAEHHIAQLTQVITPVLDSNLYRLGAEIDPQTRRPTYRVLQLPKLPSDITIIAGDAIQNLRTALDHLVQQLYLVSNPGAGINRRIAFFIGTRHTAQEYEPALRGIVQGLSPGAVNDILALEAYKGGQGHQLWVLNELNNADKHRLIISMIIDVGVNIGQQMSNDLAKAVGLDRFPKLDFFIKGATEKPLEAGDVLYSGLPDERVDPNQQFRFEIAFFEPGICEGGPIIPTLHQLAQRVSGIVNAFKPHLA